MQTFLNANGVITPLPQVEKNKLLDVKLFSSYCERIGRPVIDWTKVTKADFNSIVLYMEEEQVTIPHHTLESHANAIKPRNVANTTMVTVGCTIAARLRNATSTKMLTPTMMIDEPRNVTCSTMVMPIPMIGFVSASPDVEATDNPEVKAVEAPEIKAVDSPLVNQSPLKSPTNHPVPVKQQDTLHDFFHYANQGTFDIPCGGKIYHPLPSMDPVAWPQEKSTCLPRTLAQLACQDSKKEPLDNFAIMLSPLYPIVPCFL